MQAGSGTLMNTLDTITSWVHEIDAAPAPGNVLSLALWPNEHLEHVGEIDRQAIIDQAMTGVTRSKVEAVDGFGYNPEFYDHIDMNLVMLAAEKNSVVVLRDWVRRWGPGILRHRNDELASPLICALGSNSREAKDFILSCASNWDGQFSKNTTENEVYVLGLPEAAALGMKELTLKLVKQYDDDDDDWPEHKKHPSGLSGVELAYLFSGVSGKVDWVEYWMDKVEDISVGGKTSFGNVLRYAVRGGNVELVRMLLGKGIPTETSYSTGPLVKDAIADVNMLRYLVEEVGQSLDTMDDYRMTMMDHALLSKCTETCIYLLAKRPLREWNSLAMKHGLDRCLFMWSPPRIFVKFLEDLSLGDAQLMLRQAVRVGNSLVTRILVEEKGASLGEKPPALMLTHFQEALCSGSLRTVDYLLEKQPESILYKHDNGFNAVTAAIMSGSAKVLRRIADKQPELLNANFWDSFNGLMLSTQIGSPGGYEVLLEQTFYEKHCRRGLLDVNSKDDKDRTALYLAVKNGDVRFVDRLLRCRRWLDFKELQATGKVNELFVEACGKTTMVELLACLESHGLELTGVPTESLALKAANSGVLFFSDHGALGRLRAMDSKARLDVSDEILLHAIIENASDWAVETGRLAKFVRCSFAGKECMLSEAVFEQVLLRIDVSLAELFTDKISDRDCGDMILTVLESMGKSKSRFHRTVLRRCYQFITWLMQITNPKAYESSGRVLEVMKHAVKADFDLCLIEGLLPLSLKFSPDELSAIIFEAASRCQLSNIRIVAKFLTPSVSLSTIRGENGQTLISAALSTDHVKCAGSIYRFPLVEFLLKEYDFDFSVADKDGVTLPMVLLSLGHIGLVDYLVSKFDADLMLLRTKKHESIIHYACKSGHPLVFTRALPAVERDMSLLLGPAGETPIHEASSFGHLGLLRFLVQEVNMDVDARDANGITALENAGLRYHGDAEEYLEAVTDPKIRPEISVARKTVNEWLRGISNAVGKNIKLNSNGISAFTYDNHTIVIEVPHRLKSFFIYAAFDGKKYSIDEDVMDLLLRLPHPSNDFQFCSALDPKCSDPNQPDAMISYNGRIEEYDGTKFRNILELFIERTIQMDAHLCSCIAQKALEATLASLDEGKSFPRVKKCLDGYIAETPRRVPLRAEDIQIFRGTLQIFMSQISLAIGKTLKVHETGICAFTYDNLVIAMSPASASRCRFQTTVKTVHSSTVPANLLRHALRLNYLQQETRGGMISSEQVVGGTEFTFYYEDSLNQITHTDFRNILENFIDTALSLQKELRNPPDSIVQERSTEDGIPDWNDNKIAILRTLKANPLRMVDVIFALPPKPIIENTRSMINLVAVAGETGLWTQVCQAVICKAHESGARDLVKSSMEVIIEELVKYGMTSGEVLADLAKADPKLFLSKGFRSLYPSELLLKRGLTSQLAHQLTMLAKDAGLTDEQVESVIVEEWDKNAINIINAEWGPESEREVVKCLEFITKECSADENDALRVLHSAGSTGSIRVVEYLLKRFENLALDEDTLVWACRCEKHDLAEFILSHSPELPRSKALSVSATRENAGSMIKRLLETKPGAEEEEPDLGSALYTVAQMSIASQKWDILELVTGDDRLHIENCLRELLMFAYASNNHPSRAIKILLSSKAALRAAYSTALPWQIEAIVQREDVLPTLFVSKENCLPREMSENIWSFSQRVFDDSPRIPTAETLWKEVREALASDFGTEPITRTGSTFSIPKIGQISYNNERVIKIQKMFDASKAAGLLSRDMLLSISEILGGCYLASNDCTKSVHLKKALPLHPNFCYRDLRQALVDFKRVCRAFERMIEHFQSTKILLPVSKLSFVVPDMLDYTEATFSRKERRLVGGRQKEYNYDMFDHQPKKRARLTMDLENQDVDTAALLRANMDRANEIFFTRSESRGVFRACVYTKPDAENLDALLEELSERARFGL